MFDKYAFDKDFRTDSMKYVCVRRRATLSVKRGTNVPIFPKFFTKANSDSLSALSMS